MPDTRDGSTAHNRRHSAIHDSSEGRLLRWRLPHQEGRQSPQAPRSERYPPEEVSGYGRRQSHSLQAVMCINMYGSTETQRAVGYYEVPPEEVTASMKEVIPVGRGMKVAEFIFPPSPNKRIRLQWAAAHMHL